MKPYVLDYANDIINGNKQNTMMRGEMREKIKKYIEAVLEDYKHGLISVDETMYLLSREDKFGTTIKEVQSKQSVNVERDLSKRGRPRISDEAVKEAVMLYESGQYTMKEVVSITKISQATIFRRVREKRNAESN